MNNKFLTGSEILLLLWGLVIVLKVLGLTSVSWWLIGLPIFIFLGICILLSIIYLIALIIAALWALILFIKGN